MFSPQTNQLPSEHVFSQNEPAVSPLRVSVPVADVRAAPNHSSELLTQAVLATPAWALETHGSWLHVDLPDYRGWLQKVCLSGGVGESGDDLVVVLPRTEGVLSDTGERLTVFGGTVLARQTQNTSSITVSVPARGSLELPSTAVRPFQPDHSGGVDRISDALSFARRMLGVRYRWGGWTADGIDCSGLTQLSYRIVGRMLPRDAHEQYGELTHRVERKELEPGDLVFFGEGQVTHVGLCLGQDYYIHASGRAGRTLISRLEHPATEVDQWYADRFFEAKRVIPNE